MSSPISYVSMRLYHGKDDLSMAITRYLAMTAAEFGGNSPLPPKIAWMACHFSPYSTGLSNVPRQLPSGSVLMLNDITPIHGHDPQRIAAQLRECMDTLKCSGLLLDFQRPGCTETAALAKHLTEALPCPVAVSEPYSAGLDCPVFLPPVPHHVPLEAHLAPWKGREIWLEIALDGEILTLTPEGASFTTLPPGETHKGGHREEKLHCHYIISQSDAQACFTLWRTPEDLDTLLAEADTLGVHTAVGLYQELGGT